jgi:crossover junction endodeoxyribonuclease RusA
MIDFFVSGVPKPAGSKTAFVNKHTGKAIVTDACKTSKDWKSLVAYTAREYYKGELLTGPVIVTMTFYQTRPACHYGSGKNAAVLKPSAPTWPTGKPDVLKLTRAVEDACTGILWKDDSQIVDERIIKRYGDKPGVKIQVTSPDYIWLGG